MALLAKTRRTRHRLEPGAARGHVSLQTARRCSSNRILRRGSSLPTRQILIATPRLEFPSTHSKQSPLTFSNREYIAVFQFLPPRSALPLSPGLFHPLISDHQSLIIAFLIGTPRLEF